jgi:hypothetical protein
MTATKLGTIIRTDGTIERRPFKKKTDLREFYDAIGGGCTCFTMPSVWIPGHQLAMYADDDGYANGQPYNGIATLLARQTIIGNVIIFGESIVSHLARLGLDVTYRPEAEEVAS